MANPNRKIVSFQIQQAKLVSVVINFFIPGAGLWILNRYFAGLLNLIIAPAVISFWIFIIMVSFDASYNIYSPMVDFILPAVILLLIIIIQMFSARVALMLGKEAFSECDIVLPPPTPSNVEERGAAA